MRLTFTDEYSESELLEILKLIGANTACIRDYATHQRWLITLARELRDGTKYAFKCWNGDQCVGVIIYQRHKVVLNAVEIKNATTHPGYFNRITPFLFTLVEQRAARLLRMERRRSIVCDTKQHNTRTCRLLQQLGYRPIGLSDLYGSGTLDVQFIKSFMPKQIRTALRR